MDDVMWEAVARPRFLMFLLVRGRRPRRWRPSASNVATALDGVRMIHRARHMPAQLSGGQQQRVTVARAIAGGLSDGVLESELFGHVKARSPTPAPIAPVASNSPTATRCSSTRSPTCRPPSKPACSACCRPASSIRSAARGRARSMSGCSLRPTPTSDDLMLRPRGDAAPRLEEMTLEQVERYLIERALATQGGNVSEAARVLGLSRSALYRRLASLGIRS